MLRDSITIPPNGHISFNPSRDLNRSGGNIIVSSDKPLNGLVLIGGEDSPMYDIDMKKDLHREFIISQVDSGGSVWDSIVIVQNPNTYDINVRATIINNNGQTVFTINLPLRAHGGNQVNISDFVSISSGSIKLESTNNFTAFMLYDGTKSGYPWKAGLSAVSSE